MAHDAHITIHIAVDENKQVVASASFTGECPDYVKLRPLLKTLLQLVNDAWYDEPVPVEVLHHGTTNDDNRN